MTEADTCRTRITPKLQAAGWESDPHSIAEQRSFTDGRIIVHGNKAVRRKGKRADYILRYTRDFPIAVVEAKPGDEPAATGLQQSKDYAEILKLKFAYATNGTTIIEFDYITGLERELTTFPTPADLWSRLRAAERLTDDTAAQRLREENLSNKPYVPLLIKRSASWAGCRWTMKSSAKSAPRSFRSSSPARLKLRKRRASYWYFQCRWRRTR
jgi:type I restriction enzyme R subunit